MIWSALTRMGALLSMGLLFKDLHDLATRDIKPNRIYSSQEAARYLGISRTDVIKLLRSNKLRGKMVEGNYRIPGQSILGYLDNEI